MLRKTIRPGLLSILAFAALSVTFLGTRQGRTTGMIAGTGGVGGKIAVQKDGAAADDRSGIVVYLESVPNAPLAPAAPKRIAQHELNFVPDFAVVTKGTSIDFPNEDKVFHNVFSLSQPAKFDLGLYKSGESKSVTFNHVGVVNIYCNIHPQMSAKVKVVENSFYAITARDGSFLIPNVPPGTYPVVAWHPHGDTARGEVTIAAGKIATTALGVIQGETGGRHQRKDGTPYGRYQ